MKKLLLSILLLLPLFGFAQKGMQGVGVHLGSGYDFDYGTNASSIEVCYQRDFSNKFRLSYSLFYLDYPFEWTNYDSDSYYYGNSYFVGIDGHYFLNDVRRLRPYIIGGIHMGSYEIDYSGTTIGLKLGVGLNYRIGYRWSAQMEIPLYLVEPVGCFIPTFGIAYNF